MLDVTYGQSRSPEIARRLAAQLSEVAGSLYLGYPLLPTAGETLTIDALLVSRRHGVVAFAIRDLMPENDQNAWRQVIDEQDRIALALESTFLSRSNLRKRRRLRFAINIVTVFPADIDSQVTVGLDEIAYCSIGRVKENVEKFGSMQAHLLPHVEAALQAVTTMKSRPRRRAAAEPESKGCILTRIEQQAARLDQRQQQAAVESPDGPQRIRGLAGSGKTTVLALKAAYLHVQNPDWTIVVTFYSKSLYPQLQDLIRHFSFGFRNEPDWERLRILHAWGSEGRNGVYAEIADSVGLPVRSCRYGSSIYGREGAFGGVCNELSSAVSAVDSQALYDAVLIDEAQDLPPEFFRLTRQFIRHGQKIIWAYDEMQQLSESTMPTIAELFGVTESGDPQIRSHNAEGQPRQDFVLEVCYRNPPEVLTVAHALGLGIYRTGGQIQGFDDPGTWIDIGYELVDGELSLGADVTLRRAQDTYPEHFPKMPGREEIVQTRVFRDEIAQAAWIAESVHQNMATDRLRMDDILIVLPTSQRDRKDAAVLSQALQRFDINSHLVGVTSNHDEVFKEQSIALAPVHRSKGNEAAMVYVVNAQDYMVPTEQIRNRNALCTAITRSKAWVRLCGWGPAMDILKGEIQRIVADDYMLQFTVPTQEELEQTRKIHRELSPSEREQYRSNENVARSLMEALNSGRLQLDALPSDVREGLQKHFQAAKT